MQGEYDMNTLSRAFQIAILKKKNAIIPIMVGYGCEAQDMKYSGDQWAVNNGKIDLLQKGTVAYSEAKEALKHSSCKNNRLDLFKENCPVAKVTSDEWVIYTETAARNGSADVLKYIISIGKCAITDVLVGDVACSNNVELMKFVLRKFQEVRAANPAIKPSQYWKNTALCKASGRGNLQMVQYLISQKFAPKTKKKATFLNYAFFMAVKNDHLPIVSFLRDNGMVLAEPVQKSRRMKNFLENTGIDSSSLPVTPHRVTGISAQMFENIRRWS
jgi:hypothetical protein